MSDVVAFVCRESNDLYQAAGGGGNPRLVRVDSPVAAVKAAAPGAALLVLADGYPDQHTVFPPEFWNEAEEKRLRVLVEFPDCAPGCRFGEPIQPPWERGVVASDMFPGLTPMRILAVHDCRLLPVETGMVHIVYARVAGFDTAIYGLPETAHPLLFEVPGGNVLVATTKLSQFVTARYAPEDAWQAIWTGIFAWLLPGRDPVRLGWTPTVRPAYRACESLPEDVEARALKRGAAWYANARLLAHRSWPDDRSSWTDRVGPVPEHGWPPGDGSAGMLEGFSSTIRLDGSQHMRWWKRSDCMGEAAMALAFDGVVNGNDGQARVAANLGDFVFIESEAATGPRDDPEDPAYGLLSWDRNEGQGVYYGDDNARALLGALTASVLLKIDRWDEKILRCVMANFRTTGPLGFRGERLDSGPLRENGWRHYSLTERTHYAPHFESYMWACFLWAYEKTGANLFLERAKTAIRMTMAAYPDTWRWTNGLQQERARMLLCLAWLLRVEDTPEHRAWLRHMAEELLAHQDACGAIREELGPEGKGAFGPPKSNDEYGKSEAPLIQENGDPLCDLLYTSNFALLGLHEAACVTDEALYRDAEDRLARFLCRIQIRSERHPELDGGWFRAFDYRRWEYWASNADHGWGAWSIESGWTCGWINAVLAMRQMRTSLWELAVQSRADRHFDKLVGQVFGNAFDGQLQQSRRDPT